MNRVDDLRLGDLLQSEPELGKLARKRVGLIGVPCDEGVVRNGGRPGARDGPKSLRPILQRTGSLDNREYNISLNSIQFRDLGDVTDWTTLEEMHVQLAEKVRLALANGYLPICVGGGNDQSWANASGWINHLRIKDNQSQLAVINVDAHLDVRPLLEGTRSHSGSPFRQIVEFSNPKEDLRLIEFGAQGSQCAAAHAQYVQSKGGVIHWLSILRNGSKSVIEQFRAVLDELKDRRVFFSFDIDSIVGADCPGVSCPAVIGLSSQEALDMCLEAGRRRNVDLMDISEYNPHIEADRTGRLITNMIYYFLLGVSRRYDS